MDLAATEVIELIKACKEAGVSEFDYSGVKLRFGAMAGAAASTASQIVGSEDLASEQRSRDEAEIRIKQDQLETLRLADPYVYEQIIAFDQQQVD